MHKGSSSGYAEHREALMLRLRRMEGQVRGLQRMVEEDRYCLDIVTQISALTAAAREVELIVIESHLGASVREAVQEGDGEATIKEMTNVLRKALRS